jgi:hypothetical protein
MVRVLHSAKKNRAIVKSLFPANVRDRLLKQEEEKQSQLRRTSFGSMGSVGGPRRNNSDNGSRRCSNESREKRSSMDMIGRRGSNEARKNSNEARRYSNDKPRRRHSGDNLIADVSYITSNVVSGAVSGMTTAVSGVSSSVTTVVSGVGSMAGSFLTPLAPSKLKLKFFLSEANNKGFHETQVQKSLKDVNKMDRPIADLFPHSTVLFADISGFTAWVRTMRRSFCNNLT